MRKVNAIYDIYLPMYWVDLSSDSRVTVNFFLVQNKKKKYGHPQDGTQVNSALEQIDATILSMRLACWEQGPF